MRKIGCLTVNKAVIATKFLIFVNNNQYFNNFYIMNLVHSLRFL